MKDYRKKDIMSVEVGSWVWIPDEEVKSLSYSFCCFVT